MVLWKIMTDFFIVLLRTHSARSWVGDLPSVSHPLVVGSLLVGKRPIENHTDVSHGVDTHRRAFKHSSGGRQEMSQCQHTGARRYDEPFPWDNYYGSFLRLIKSTFLPTHSAVLSQKGAETLWCANMLPNHHNQSQAVWHTDIQTPTYCRERPSPRLCTVWWVYCVCKSCLRHLSLAPHVFSSAGLNCAWCRRRGYKQEQYLFLKYIIKNLCTITQDSCHSAATISMYMSGSCEF